MGCTGTDDGEVLVGKLGRSVGSEVWGSEARYRTKIGAYWNAVRERESWKKVYGEGLF